MKTLKCDHCGDGTLRLKACRGCLDRYYCSKYCQKRAWNKWHRTQCKKNWIKLLDQMEKQKAFPIAHKEWTDNIIH